MTAREHHKEGECDGDVGRHTMQRLASLFGAAIGRRLTYAELIA